VKGEGRRKRAEGRRKKGEGRSVKRRRRDEGGSGDCSFRCGRNRRL
jgi:hypothetical protein